MKKPKRSGTAASPAHLLDTSTLLWALESPERLSPRARRRVDAGENIVSVGSYWEVVIKAQKGLLSMRRPPHLVATGHGTHRRAYLADSRESCDGPGRASHASQRSFDRILIAQAIAEGLDFLTNDEPISAYPV